MTRTDFQLIAGALKRCRAPRFVVEALADVLRTRNPKFDRRRFYVESGHPAVVPAPDHDEPHAGVRLN